MMIKSNFLAAGERGNGVAVEFSPRGLATAIPCMNSRAQPGWRAAAKRRRWKTLSYRRRRNKSRI